MLQWRRLRVLLVEDDPGDVLMIREAIESLPAPRDLQVAVDGQDAWDYLLAATSNPAVGRAAGQAGDVTAGAAAAAVADHDAAEKGAQGGAGAAAAEGAVPVLPDVILLDLNMPRMDGRELLARIKSSEALRRIPTVVFTTSRAQEDILASYDQHANVYVSKPVDVDDLFETIKHIDRFFGQITALPGHHQLA